jgi:hypothetical protein
MKKQLTDELNDDLRSEYDLENLLKDGVQGKYAERYRAGTNLVRLDPDVAEVFQDDESVNQALRLVMKLSELSRKAA